MRTIKLTILILTLIGLTFPIQAGKLKFEKIRVKAPFDMPVYQVPDFSDCPRFSIDKFGAKPGDKSSITKAIAKAMIKANKIGGGVVVIPAGEWFTGAVHLKSNVELYLEKGATLLFSDEPDDYLPAVHSSWEGVECYNYSPLIYAYNCKNISIAGPGKIKAKMDLWNKWAGRPSGHMNNLKRLYYMAFDNVPVEKRYMINDSAHFRPQLIQINRSSNIKLENFTVRNSPFWTIHLYMAKDVVVRGLDVYAHGHNNDGIDPEMTQNLLVENCVFDQGDDAIAVKSGRAPDGWNLNTPTRNIVFRNLSMKNGHQLLAIGSELSGGVENVLVDSCVAAPNASMFHLVFIKTNERRGGFVRNIYVQNVKGNYMKEGILGIETDVMYQWKDLVPTIIRKLTPIENVQIKNIQANDVSFLVRILGQKELPVKNIGLENVQAEIVRGPKAEMLKNVENYSLSGPRKYIFGNNPAKFELLKNTQIVSLKDTALTSKGFGIKPYAEIKTNAPGSVVPYMSSDKGFYFSVRLPEGRYRIKMNLGGNPEGSSTTLKAENRRLMMENVITGPNEVQTKSVIVDVRTPRINEKESIKLKDREIPYQNWDNLLNLELTGARPCISSLEILDANELPVLFLAGNSTVTDQAYEPWASWGQMISNFLYPEIAVANYAESGETLLGFRRGKRLEKILSLMHPGDFIMIEFAHNDQKPGGNHLDPMTTYKQTLREYVAEVQRKGGIPILVSSTRRRKFDEKGMLENTLGDYPVAVRELAKELNIGMIDLNAMTKILYESMGEKESTHAFVHYPANTYPNQKEALADNTHFNPYGAYELAKCIAMDIIRQDLPLNKYVKPELAVFDPSRPDPWFGPNAFKWYDSPASEAIKPDGN